ncbi:MAG: bifunctional phosphoribosylaminoimidazolecarboxamide formyltransferase/IMP cyclohydrolase, partial [Planctomycetota bacterium]
PSMVRSAAKNHARVAVLTDPRWYAVTLAEMRQYSGSLTPLIRQKLALGAFALTNQYDEAISEFLVTQMIASNPVGKAGTTVPLRYGENPHQKAWLTTPNVQPDQASVAFHEQLHGKELGYINLLDSDAALACVKEFTIPACCIVKHATPCGVGVADSAHVASPSAVAFERAYEGDPLAAFGGVLAVNRPIDHAAATRLADGQKFIEVIVAPEFDADALNILRERWKNVRLLHVGPLHRERGRADREHAIGIYGGQLFQERDLVGVIESEWKVVSDRQPTEAEMAALKFNWLCVKHVKSNAIVVGGEVGGGHGTYGIGGGQVDRVAAAMQAVAKAGDRAKGAVAASDAFFPFPDGPEALLTAGVTAIVQPGGSRNDQMTIDLVNQRGAAMIFTGRRHFRH